MINYAFIFFLPGSAGNFFSRCLNLIGDDVYCWVSANEPKLHLTIQEKFKLFGYESSKNNNNWVKDFESKLLHYSEYFKHHDLENNSISIWPTHPTYEQFNYELSGEDDIQCAFYIDAKESWEWCILNAMYKDSYINGEWLKNGERMRTDDNIKNICLSKIINSPLSLINEVKLVADTYKREVSVESQEMIIDLWHQWDETTLKEKNFADFKKQIGWWGIGKL